MKKLLFFTIFIILFSGISNAQTNNIKFNITNLAVATYTLSFEHVVGAKTSLQLGVLYTGYKISGTSWSGLGIMPELRLYFSGKDAPHGIYFAPCLRYQNFTFKSTDVLGVEAKASASSFGGGAVIGAQGLFFNDVLVIDAYLGLVYLAGSVKVTEGSASDLSTGSATGILPRIGLNIGFAF